MAATAPDERHTDHVNLPDVNWLNRARWGARLLFWTLLVYAGLSYAVGFATPLLVFSGIVSPDFWRWLSLLHAAAALPLLVGALAITTPTASEESKSLGNRFRRALRSLACLDAVGRVAVTCLYLAFAFSGDTPLVRFIEIISISAILVGLLYLSTLSQYLAMHRMTRAWKTVTVARTILVGVGVARDVVFRTGLLPMWHLTGWASVQLPFQIGVGLWGLTLLWRFGTHLGCAAGGGCIRCGYLLTGLPEPRCPECGLAALSGPEMSPDAPC